MHNTLLAYDDICKPSDRYPLCETLFTDTCKEITDRAYIYIYTYIERERVEDEICKEITDRAYI